MLSAFNPKTNQFVENLLGFEASAKAPFGAVFEYSAAAKDFMAQLCLALKDKGAAAISFDYGYEKCEFANTLQALKNHQKVEVISATNDRDITAHVDFGLLDKVVKNFGLNSSLISKRKFLLDCGIEERRKNLRQKNPQKREEIDAEINRLIAPNQMGELFKCHIIWK
jgi:SAM-dependent MidA family methyltransferase